MDFQTLARRDLQALCKRNKIPANMTNVAMAEALKALELVEGIDEIMQPSQSGTAQSSTESFEMGDITSPFVPQTAGRSTRRSNIPKPAPESVNPTTRTRRTTRKTQVKDANAIETPAPMSQSNRKKVQTASACLNMDSQLMECEDMDTKDSLMTPAPMGTTSRRSRLDESAAKRVYSTRRSARLAVKSNVETSTDGSQGFKKELADKDGLDNFNELSGVYSTRRSARLAVKSNVETSTDGSQGFKKELADKDGLDNFNELSGFTDESEVVSIGKEESEVVSHQKKNATMGEEIKMGRYAEEEARLEKEKCDYEEIPVNVKNEVQEKNGSPDVEISEIETAFEKSIEEVKPEDGESSEVQQDFVANVVEIKADGNTGFNDEIKEELNNGIIIDGGSRDVTDLDMALVKLTELKLQQATKEDDSEYVDSLDMLLQSNENEANNVKSLQLEEIVKVAADPEQSDEPFADLSEQLPESYFEGLENEPIEMKVFPLEESRDSAELVPSGEQYADLSEQIPKSSVIIQPAQLSPSRDSVSVTMKRVVFSENIESGTKLVVRRDDDVKMAENSVDNGLHDMSVRKLAKMLKEKLEITKKQSKNQNDNKPIPRTALQVISENRMVEEAQN